MIKFILDNVILAIKAKIRDKIVSLERELGIRHYLIPEKSSEDLVAKYSNEFKLLKVQAEAARNESTKNYNTAAKKLVRERDAASKELEAFQDQ